MAGSSVMLQGSTTRPSWTRHASRRVGGRRFSAGDRRGLRLRASLRKQAETDETSSEAVASLVTTAVMQRAMAGLAAVGLVRPANLPRHVSLTVHDVNTHARTVCIRPACSMRKATGLLHTTDLLHTDICAAPLGPHSLIGNSSSTRRQQSSQ